MTTTTPLSTLDRVRLLSAFQALSGMYGDRSTTAAHAMIEAMTGHGVGAGIKLPPAWSLDRYLEWHGDDFATDHLDSVARALALTVNDAIRSVTGAAPYGGGCRAYYTTTDWAARGEDHAEGAAFVIVHDGGDLSLSSGRADVLAKVSASLEVSGYYLQPCTGWFSAVYRIATDGDTDDDATADAAALDLHPDPRARGLREVYDGPRADGEGAELLAELTAAPSVRYRCPECQGGNVQRQLWVHVNTDTVGGLTGHYAWCDDCQIEIDDPEEGGDLVEVLEAWRPCSPGCFGVDLFECDRGAPPHRFEIQRCDDCNRFADDATAAAWLTTHLSRLSIAPLAPSALHAVAVRAGAWVEALAADIAAENPDPDGPALAPAACDCVNPGRCEHAERLVAEQAGSWIARLDTFDADSKAEEYTDTGTAWELLNAARAILDAARAVTL